MDRLKNVYSANSAACYGDVNGLRRLVALGHDMNCANRDGRTPLHCAAAAGHLEVVCFLLYKNVDTQARDSRGNTALDDAIRYGRNHIIYILAEPDKEAIAKIAA